MPKRSIVIRPGDVELVLAKPIPIPDSEGRDAERRLMEQVHAAIAANYVDQSSGEETVCP
jgi:hypothetical protein